MIEIHTHTKNGYSFSLKSESGDLILNSESFTDKHEMDKVIHRLKTVSLNRNDFERRTNTDGKFLFILKDGERQTIGRSEPYDSEAGMENGIKNLQENIKSLI